MHALIYLCLLLVCRSPNATCMSTVVLVGLCIDEVLPTSHVQQVEYMFDMCPTSQMNNIRQHKPASSIHHFVNSKSYWLVAGICVLPKFMFQSDTHHKTATQYLLPCWKLNAFHHFKLFSQKKNISNEKATGKRPFKGGKQKNNSWRFFEVPKVLPSISSKDWPILWFSSNNMCKKAAVCWTWTWQPAFIECFSRYVGEKSDGLKNFRQKKLGAGIRVDVQNLLVLQYLLSLCDLLGSWRVAWNAFLRCSKQPLRVLYQIWSSVEFWKSKKLFRFLFNLFAGPSCIYIYTALLVSSNMFKQ